MKRALFSLIVLFSSLSVFATDISGDWYGTRYQFDKSQQKYVDEFHYHYSLEQSESTVTGVITITNLEGYYAKMKLRGFVEGEKFYFEEYEVIDATRPENTIWCFKKGVLNISRDEVIGISLSGKTPSYMEHYGLACTGGYTYLNKDAEAVSEDVLENDDVEIVENDLSLTVFPNPYVSVANIKFQIQEEAKVVLDVVNIKGELISNIANEILDVGEYTYEYIPNESTPNAIYYIRLKVNNKVYSKAIQKSGNSSQIK